jgi:hypothetical protein
MGVLEHLAQAAAVILLFELIVVVLVFLAVTGGLAFGLHWIRGKTDPAFSRVNEYTGIGTGYVHRGTAYAALPFLKVGGIAATMGGTLDAIEKRVRQNRAREAGLELANEAAGPEPAELEPDVLV